MQGLSGNPAYNIPPSLLGLYDSQLGSNTAAPKGLPWAIGLRTSVGKRETSIRLTSLVCEPGQVS